MDNVAHFITGHEQTQLNRVCYFHFLDVCIELIQTFFILLLIALSGSSDTSSNAVLEMHVF